MKFTTLLKIFPFFWLTGLHLPVIYTFFISNISYVFKQKDKYITIGLLFIILQLFSIYLSIYNNYFDPLRVVASLHNTLIYFFLLLGYSLSFTLNHNLLNKAIKLFLIWIVLLSIFSIIYYYLNGSEFMYQIFSLKVQFFRVGWLSDWAYPRLLIFSNYPNGVAILLFLLFSLYLYTCDKLYTFKNILFGFLFLILMFFTGSRTIMALSIILVGLMLIDKKWKYYLVIILGLGVISLIYFNNFLDILINSRKASNDMRELIYGLSISTWLNTNLLFGLGLKPYIGDMHYPLGSHSTILGVFVKFGLVGGSIFITIFILLLLTILRNILFISISFYEHRKLLINYTLLSILMILIVEDIDAIELNAVLIGIIIGFTKNNFKFKKGS